MPRTSTREITPKTNLESLRKEAKRWLKSLRAGDTRARERLQAALDAAPEAPGLRDVQHALAREYGMEGWLKLKAALAEQTEAQKTRAEVADIVLRHVWDGENGWRADGAPASRLARRHPDLAQENMLLAVLYGDLEEVRRRIEANPKSATQKGGPLGWEPLQYLAYGRLDLLAVRENSVAIASLLLDHGADPNAIINDGWDNPFKPVTGAIGLGEGVKPPHPQAEALARLLIERGAEPYDTQALYNTSIVDDNPFWMDLLYSYSQERGDAAKWNDAALAMQLGKTGTLDYLLGNAVDANHLRRAEWLLDRGADPNSVNAYSGRPHFEDAQIHGFQEMTALLVRRGARPVPLAGRSAAQAALMRLDRDEAARFAAAHPDLLKSGHLFIAAVGSPQALRLLLDLGADVNARCGDGSTPLHWAAHADVADAARLLIEHGAEIDIRDSKYNSTPLGWAVFLKKPAVVELLAPLSRDMFALASGGLTERLRAVLREEKSLANAQLDAQPGRVTPLLCLPDDEDMAAEVASILLEAGADPLLGRREGLDAEAFARRRGLVDAADTIAEAG
jgi:ankyrin repeat protein